MGGGGEAESDAFVHVEEAEGLPEGAQGDVEGVVAGGGVVEAVEAEGEEFQLVQEGVLGGVVVLEGQLLLEVAVVAADGGRGGAVLGGQGPAGEAVEQALVDIGPGGMIADGAAFFHERQFPVASSQFPVPSFQ